MARIVLAMSGGVDSSVAAHLLRAEGHEIIGLFMRHGPEMAESACAVEAKGATLPIIHSSTHKQGCCSSSDAADARRVADRLDIPFYALDFSDEFGQIMDYFTAEYTAGRTPNPCVMCNNWLKFGKLCEYADSVGAEFVATGHYARLIASHDRTQAPALCRGVDPVKDQSYVLFGIARDVLRRVMFPVGDYPKEQIRELAREIGLRVAEKKDSQEICFVPDGDYASFVRRRRGELDTSGEIVTVEGDIVGQHEGIENYTIGQRKGLGVAFGEPRYVVEVDSLSRRVTIGTRAQLARTELTAGQTNWLIDEPREPFDCCVKIRYQSQPVPATVTPLPGQQMHVRLHEPRDGIAPGQAAVCYDGDRVLGGGWIESSSL